MVCQATKGPKKNRLFMEGRSTFSEIFGLDASFLNQRLKPQTESARLPDGLLQHAIGDAACIVHSLDARGNDNNISVPRSELDCEIQKLAAVTLPKDDVHWSEYIHIASSVVDKMLDKFGKTINEVVFNLFIYVLLDITPSVANFLCYCLHVKTLHYSKIKLIQ